MNISNIDLNLLIYMDVLLREQNVTKAANLLGISQPAMSNSLRRLRDLFGDPLLVRTSNGMRPTERALELAPQVHKVVTSVERVIQPQAGFDAIASKRVFRIAASDYAEASLLLAVIKELGNCAPGISLDILTPSDVGFADVELGHVDMVINRFDTIPQSFHQRTLWTDTFSCLLNRNSPLLNDFSLEGYLKARHVWVSKTGMGVGVGMNPQDVQRVGWVDTGLLKLGLKRKITVYTRHYQTAMLLAQEQDLVVTLPSRAAVLQKNNPHVVVKEPPFYIAPIELKMAWSPLLQQNAPHRWLRKLIVNVASGIQ